MRLIVYGHSHRKQFHLKIPRFKDSPFLSVLRFPLLKIPHFKDSLFPVPHSYSSIPRSLFKNSQRPETPEKSQNSVLSLVSRFGCFVLRSSFSSASFSMLPTTLGILTTPFSYFSLLSFPQPWSNRFLLAGQTRIFVSFICNIIRTWKVWAPLFHDITVYTWCTPWNVHKYAGLEYLI